MKRNALLGRQFMNSYKVLLDMGTNICHISGLQIPMSDLTTVRSFIRLVSDIAIPPNSYVRTKGKYHKRANIPYKTILTYQQSPGGFLENEPGLSVIDGIAIASARRQIPVSIVNNTGRWFQLKKGNVVANISVVGRDCEIANVQSQACTADVTDPNARIKDIEHPNLTKSQQVQFNKLMQRNSDIFAKSEWDIGTSTLVKAHIDTGNAAPIRKKAYRTPFSYRAEVNRQVTEMLKHNIIRPSNSDWAAPIVCVKKKSGEVRMCVDYRQLNDVTKNISHPLPLIDDLFANLSGAKYFTSLDFIKGYYQVEMDASSISKTAFVTQEMGLMEFLRLPFGTKNAPSLFQMGMNKLLNGLNYCASAYLDDVVIWSKTFKHHLRDLQAVFNRIRQANMKLKRNKCEFFKDELEYLGHIVTNKGELKVNPNKVKVIAELKPPTSVKEVRSLIGVTSYYRRFIPSYAKIAQPLTMLTKKHAKYVWTDLHQKSFELLKAALIAEPVLALPKMDKPFQVFTDASDRAIGGILTQEYGDVYKPVYYLSHQLSSTQQKWSTIEKECYAILFSIEKFRPFLEGSHFKVFTDHHPLKYINSAENKNAKLQRWATKISSFGADIHFIRGVKNVQADFLSRLSPQNIPKLKDHSDIEARIDDVALIDLDRIDLSVDQKDEEDSGEILNKDLKMNEAQEKDKHIVNIIKSLSDKGNKSKYFKKYLVKEGTLYHVDLDENLHIVVPEALKQPLIKETHEGSLGGHIGRDRTFDTLRKRYYWKGLASQVYDYINKCVKCNQQNLQTQVAPLQETPIAQFPFERINIDLAGPYLETERENRYCFTITDQFSGWIESIPIPDKQSTTIANILIHQIFARHSWPRYMTSDNGNEFVSEIIKTITQLGHINHIKTSPYHPQSNSFAERPHRTMIDCLAKISDKNDWDLYLSSFCAAYNCTQSASRKFSPFFLLYHRDPILPLDSILRDREKYYGEEFLPQALERMHSAYRIVRRRLKEQRERNKEYIDRRRRAKEVTYEVGDPVYLRNHMQMNKLDPKWLPHYRITVRTGPASFVIQNQLSGKTRRVHANDIRLAELDTADVPLAPQRNIRRARLVADDSDTDGESVSSEEESTSESEHTGYKLDESINSDKNKGDNIEVQNEPQVPEKPEESAKIQDEVSTRTRPQGSSKLDALAKLKAMHITSVDTEDERLNTKLANVFALIAENLR